MTLPGLVGSHGLTTDGISAFIQGWSGLCDLPEEVVSSGVIEQVKPLLLAVVKLHRPATSVHNKYEDSTREKTDQRRTGHQQTRDKRSNSALLSSIDQTIPPEDIEVGHSVHVPRVDLSGARVDEIVLDEEGVPGVDEVDRDIISDLEVTVQSKESLEDTVHGVVEGNGVETVDWSWLKEIPVIVGNKVHRLGKTWGALVWGSTMSTEARS